MQKSEVLWHGIIDHFELEIALNQPNQHIWQWKLSKYGRIK